MQKAVGAKQSLIEQICSFHPHLLRGAFCALIFLAPLLKSDLISKSSMLFHSSIGAFVPSLQAIGITYLVGSYILIRKGMTYRMLNHLTFQWLGVLSYSLYLWQQLFLAAGGAYSTIYWCQMFPQNLGFAFIAALFSYYIVEKPFLSFKSRFSRLKPTIFDTLTDFAIDEEKKNGPNNS